MAQRSDWRNSCKRTTIWRDSSAPSVFLPETLRGIWIHGGRRFEEDNVRLFVDVEDTAENAAFFGRFKTTLKERFRQIDIWIVSYEIRVT